MAGSHREREELASIDDLLGDSDDPGPDSQPAEPSRSPTWASRLFRRALVAAIAAGAADVVLLPLGLRVPYMLLFAVFFALFAVRRALRAVEAPRLTVGAKAPAPAIGGVHPDELSDGLQSALSRWDARLSWSERDLQRFDSTVRARLAEIADERLRQRHGVTRDADPRRARDLMSERLWTFLFSPVARTPKPQELAAIVDDMEKL
jgi:hypothetical protein